MRSTPLPYRTWSSDDRARFRAEGWWTDETFGGFVAERTARFADRLALVGTDAHGASVRWSYADLRAAADAAADRLTAAGVTPGDRVVIALPNVVEHVATVLGSFLLGAVPVMALAAHRETELTAFCATADAAALVVCGDVDGTDHTAIAQAVRVRLTARGVNPPAVVDVQRAAPGTDPGVPVGTRAGTPRRPVAADPHGLGLLQLSGGTTGTSKLIPRDAAAYLYSVRASAEICGLTQDTVMLVVLPVSHNFAQSSPGVLGVLDAGGTVVLARDPSPRTAFALVARERVTTAALVPPLVQAWHASARRRSPELTSLSTVQVGGARLSEAVARDVGPVLGARLQQVFGMAEGLVCYTRDEDDDALVTGTQGRPISTADEVRVVDEHDHDVPDGEEGSLLTRGPYTIRGYYGAPDADAASFTPDGFYRTGDRVRRLPSGHLVVTGRDKDQINRGGEKVSPAEVEEAALTHPAVHDAVAVGLPDPQLGERTCLVVRAAPGSSGTERDGGTPAVTPDDLLAHLRGAGLAAFKLPDQVVVVDALPETPVGKNSRRDLRRILAAHLQTEQGDSAHADPPDAHLGTPARTLTRS